MPPAYVAGQIDAAFVWEPNVGVIERAGAKPIATTKSLDMITGGVWVARKALRRRQCRDGEAFFTAWRQAQKDYKANPKDVRQYEAKRVNMAPEQFDALIEGQSATNPDFEEILTAGFMGPPGKESELAADEASAGHRGIPGRGEAYPGRAQQLAGHCFNTKPIQALLANG